MLKKFLAKLCRRIPKNGYSFDDIKSVIIKPYFRLGDGVILTAAIVQLKEAFPNIKIGIIVTDYNIGVFKNCPLVDELIPYNFISAFRHRKKWHIYLDYPGRFATYGLLFDKILNPDYVICFEKVHKKHYNYETVHNYDIYCHKIQGLHFSEWLKMTPLDFVVKKPVRYCLKEFKENERPLPLEGKTEGKGGINILLCIEGSNRKLPPELVKELLIKLKSGEYNFILSNTQSALYYFDILKNIEGLNLTIAEKVNFDGFLKQVYFCDAIISIETAVVHIASAYKKPMVALYANNLESFMSLEYENCKKIVSSMQIGEKCDYTTLTCDEIYPSANELLKTVLKMKDGAFANSAGAAG